MENNTKTDKKQKNGGQPADVMPPTNKWHMTLAILACIILPAIVYYPSLHAPFIFDDISNIVDNNDIKNMGELKDKLIYPLKNGSFKDRNNPTRPLTYFTFALNYHFSKLDTYSYHLVNIMLHIFVTIMIFFLTYRILFYIYNKNRLTLALIVSLLFAMHPMNTEVATYITHRSESLTSLFYLLSLMCFIKTIEGKKLLYPLSILFFVLSLASKEIAATLPAVLFSLRLLLSAPWRSGLQCAAGTCRELDGIFRALFFAVIFQG